MRKRSDNDDRIHKGLQNSLGMKEGKFLKKNALEIVTKNVEDFVVVQPSVEFLTAVNANQLKEKIAPLLKPGAKIVMDMCRINFIDSSGIGALISFVNTIRSLDGSCSVCNVTKTVGETLELVKADRFLKIFDTSEQAFCSMCS